MVCSKCNKKLDKNEKFCIYCGTKVENIKKEEIKNDIVVQENGLRIASIVLGSIGIVGTLLIIFSPISLILSLVGLILGIVATKKG